MNTIKLTKGTKIKDTQFGHEYTFLGEYNGELYFSNEYGVISKYNDDGVMEVCNYKEELESGGTLYKPITLNNIGTEEKYYLDNQIKSLNELNTNEEFNLEYDEAKYKLISTPNSDNNDNDNNNEKKSSGNDSKQDDDSNSKEQQNLNPKNGAINSSEQASGNWTFTADSDIQNQLAKKLNESADKYGGAINEMYSNITNLGDYWQGEDYNAFKTGTEGYENALNDVKAFMEMYAKHMNKLSITTDNLAKELKDIIHNCTN